MAGAQQAFVVKAGLYWVVKLGGKVVTPDNSAYTQALAIVYARTWLQNSGGGELVVQDEQGNIRQKDTIYPGNDPRNVKG